MPKTVMIVEDNDLNMKLFNDLLRGRLDAFVCRGGSQLDFGAMAWLVTRAGGEVRTLDGKALDLNQRFEPEETLDMAVAVSPAVMHELMQARMA